MKTNQKNRSVPSGSLSDSPSDRPTTKQTAPKSHGGTENLVPGVSENVDRGPDGKLRKRPTQPVEPRTDNEPGIPSVLSMMLWVNEQDKSADHTPAQKRMRAFADSNPARFVDKMSALTESWLQTKRAAGLGAAADKGETDEAAFPELEGAWAQYQQFIANREEFLKWKVSNGTAQTQ